MKDRVCNSVRGWAPIFALLVAGCGVPRYALGDLRFPTRDWETRTVLAAGDVVYADNLEGSAILRIDPATLRWTEAARVRHLAGFDADGRDLWLLERRKDEARLVLRPPGGPSREIDTWPDDQIHWTAGHLVLWCPTGRIRLVPKAGGAEAVPDHPDGLRLLGVDYSSGTLWATRENGLYTLKTDDPVWRPARLRVEQSVLDEKDLSDGIEMVCFGRERFAFLRGGLVYFGRSGPEELAVERAIDLPGQVHRIAFNRRDRDVLLAWTADATWVWELVGRQGMKLPPASGAYYDDRCRKALLVTKTALAPGDDLAAGSRPVVLDGGARGVNALWRAITCLPDFAWGAATTLTPVGCLLQPVGLTEMGWERCSGPKRWWR
ncbi:MAG TPA: hypothetical protein VJB14_18465 [Planctomycetota bacterium]|nr:hypothetical protein [Planctomycetota bacterium]